MPLDPLADLRAKLEKLEILFRTRYLERSSVDDGIMHFIRSVLKMESGSVLDGDGTFRWRGSGSIAGNFEVLEGGVIKVGGVLISPIGGGRIMIGAGPNGIILDGATGSLTNGNVTIEGGKATFGVGDQKVVIDGATGKVQSGKLSLDPTANGGSIKFADGPEVYADGTTLALYSVATGAFIEVGEDELRIQGPGVDGVTVDANGVKLISVQKLPSTDGVKAWFGEDEDGYVVKVDPAVGGPIGNLSWPFPPSMVTSEYGPREAPGEGASTFHEGIDFGAAEGTPIPSAGPGVVEFAGESGGFGNCVVLNHGGGVKTRYAHMQTLPTVSVGQTVARGQTLGPVGNTGVSFGAHLHFEVEVNGVKVNPRTKLPPA